jgi:hypothetical protein
LLRIRGYDIAAVDDRDGHPGARQRGGERKSDEARADDCNIVVTSDHRWTPTLAAIAASQFRTASLHG